MIQQKIYFSEANYKKMFDDGYLGTANIVFEKALHKEDIFSIGKQSHFYIVDEDLKQRIDKAIEYIENSDKYDFSKCELLDILTGSDTNA